MALRSSLRKLNKWHCECANNKRKTGVLFGLSASKCHRAIDLHQAECQARNCQSYTVQLLIVTKGFILKPFFQDAEIMCWRMLGHFVHKCFSFWQTILTPRDAGQHKLSTEVVTEIKNLNISPGLGKNQSKKKSCDANHWRWQTFTVNQAQRHASSSVFTFSVWLAHLFRVFECEEVIVYQQYL